MCIIPLKKWKTWKLFMGHLITKNSLLYWLTEFGLNVRHSGFIPATHLLRRTPFDICSSMSMMRLFQPYSGMREYRKVVGAEWSTTMRWRSIYRKGFIEMQFEGSLQKNSKTEKILRAETTRIVQHTNARRSAHFSTATSSTQQTIRRKLEMIM